MQWERIMTYFCGFSCGISVIVALAKCLSGKEFAGQVDRAALAFVAWLGWLSALRWREAAGISAAAVAQIKQNWSAE
jgi:hypothetical protein